MKSNTHSDDVRYSLSRPRIEKETEHEKVATSVATTKFVGFLPLVYQIAPSIFLFLPASF